MTESSRGMPQKRLNRHGFFINGYYIPWSFFIFVVSIVVAGTRIFDKIHDVDRRIHRVECLMEVSVLESCTDFPVTHPPKAEAQNGTRQ